MQDRILILLESQGLSAAKFAEILGIQASSISHVLSGRNKPSFEFISRLLKSFPDINPRWLILGESPQYLKSCEESDESDLFSSAIPMQNTEMSIDDTANLNNKLRLIDRKEIKKIIFFYSDGTFEDYSPK